MFKLNDTVYIVENNIRVSSGTIIRISGNLFTLRLENSKALRLPRHRLYASEEEAINSIMRKKESGSLLHHPHMHER